MPLSEDTTEFIDVNDFATSATYSGSTVYGIFSNAYAENNDGIGKLIPTFYAAASDFSTVTEGSSTIIISSITYVIQNKQLDDTGNFVTLILEKQ
jgi:hypothetical protein